MKGEELLKAAIGQTLEAGEVQSYYSNGELADRICVTYLKFKHWFRIISTDEMTTIVLKDSSIKPAEINKNETVEYPIEPIEKSFPEFIKFKGKRLLSFKELVLKTDESQSFGLNFYFEDNLNFIIHNQNYQIDKNEYIFENQVPQNLKEK